MVCDKRQARRWRDAGQVPGDSGRGGILQFLVRRPQLRDKSQFFGMFSAQEEMDVGITTGVPLRPAAFPILPCVIARILAEDFCRLERVRPRLRVEDELGPAVLRERGILGDSLP